MARVKLTKRFIDGIRLPEGKERELFFDTALPGFGLTAFQSGRKVFFLQYGATDKRRRVTIGEYGPLTPDEARQRAMELRGEVLDGRDPMEQKQLEKQARELTFQVWVDQYLADVAVRKRDANPDKRFLGEACRRWGSRPLGSIGVDDVQKLVDYYRARGTKISSNRCLASIRACMQAAWRADKTVSNPAMKVRAVSENPGRSRTLTDAEFDALVEAVQNLDDPPVRTAFVLLLTTGARLSEVLNSQWVDIDLDAATWRIPRAKSGRSEVIPLPPVAVAALKNLTRPGPFVVPGRDPQNRRHDLKRPWESLCKQAHLDDVVIHDLRRTFGLKISRSSGLHVASKLLRHSDISVTEKHYSPLGMEELRSASDKLAEVIPFGRPGKAGSGGGGKS